MAPIPRCLCFVLTFWIVVSRPSATIRTGSPDSGWWTAKPYLQLQQSAGRQIAAGHYAEAEQTFHKGVVEARRRNDQVALAAYLSGVAGTRLARFNYQGALSAYLEAKQTAESRRDWLDLGAVDSNLSSLYEQVGDLDSAVRAGDEGVAAAKRAPGASYLAPLLIQQGRLYAKQGLRDPVPLLMEGIQAARGSLPVVPEATGWTQLGRAQMARGDLDGAEAAFLRAFCLRRLRLPRDVGISYWDLGELRLLRAEESSPGARRNELLDEAGRLAGWARREQALSPYLLRQQQGRILLARGDISGALRELGAAVDLEIQRRSGIPLGLSSVDAATSALDEKVLSLFRDTAASNGIKTRNSRLIEQAFLAQEMNRAANLGDGRLLAAAWRQKLPQGRYLGTLGKLRAEEARLRRQGARESAVSERLKLELTEMEAEVTLGLHLHTTENFRSRSSLIHFQSGLSDSAVLLSFGLGQRESFLWAVTRDSINAYQLAPREQIRNSARDFRQALEAGRSEAKELGEGLYKMLFGQLERREESKRDWLISSEDVLLQVPFAALNAGDGVYLAERHAIEIAAGALSGPGPPGPRDGSFLAVGDPIYNIADPRWAVQTGPWHSLQSWFVPAAGSGSGQLNRLPGSGREVELSAQAWPRSSILEGASARKGRFLDALAQAPAVIHLATHVLTPGGTNEAFVAFGLGPQRLPELLGTSEVGMLRVPGSLVVMTGCASASGDLRSGVGLENLARAWTIAGAGAVVATAWPVKDSNGELLANFYKYLHTGNAPEALRRSQVEMIHSGSSSSGPASWASYQIVGNQGLKSHGGTK
jgi:CHAT domain-containing protein